MISLNSVSAMDNNDTVLTSDNQIVVNEGDSIQSAIDNASAGSTIIVEKGDYSEDLLIDKELSIVGHDANIKSTNTAFMILPTANNTSISGFNIFVSDSNGTGIYVNSSDCRIIDNKITGGNVGILTDNFYSNRSGEIVFRVVNNLVIIGNDISNLAEAGISINAFNPTVSQNRVTNINNKKENGTAIGIKVNGAGLISDDLTVSVTDNYISNIQSSNDSAYGLDVGGNSVFDTLTDFNVSGNVVEKVIAPVESYGMNIGVFSLNTTLPTLTISNLNISDISSGNYENASVTGLRVSITTIGQNESSDTFVQNITINNLNALGANSKVTGIIAEGVGCADVYVVNNKLDSLKASKLATGVAGNGIDYNKFKALVTVSNNNITNIESPKIKGINVFSLGNIEINKNILFDIRGDNTTFIVGVPLSFDTNTFNSTIPANATIEDVLKYLTDLENLLNNSNFTANGNLSMVGNNLEGTGIETGFAVIVPSQIHYNRAVNLKNNVIKDSTRSYLLESYDYDPSMSNEELAYLLLKSQPDFENFTEEELRNMSVELGVFLDRFFNDLAKLTAGDVDARYNWWGTNSRPSDSKFNSNNGLILYDPWLIMRVDANPHVIEYGQISEITVDVYLDSLGNDHSFDADLYFSGPKVTLFTDKGSFSGEKSITLNWVNGKAIAYLLGDEVGLATVVAYDYDTAFTEVLILGDSPNADSPVTMPPTGNPLMLLFAIVIVLLSSIGIYTKK